MHAMVLVGLGGAVGAMARYGVSLMMLKQLTPGLFPWPTFGINLLGCMLAGVMLGLSVHLNLLSEAARVFLMTGLLGGFTTFSAFGLETLLLMQQGKLMLALSYTVLSVGLGVMVLWLACEAVKHWPC